MISLTYLSEKISSERTVPFLFSVFSFSLTQKNKCNHDARRYRNISHLFPFLIMETTSISVIIPVFPLLILLRPIPSVAIDGAEVLDKTGLLKMREGRENFKLEEALIGPSGHVPIP